MIKHLSERRVARVFGSSGRLVLFFVLTWLGVAMLLVFLLGEGYREAEQKARSDALGISALLEARLASTISRVQGDLDRIAACLPREAFRQSSVGRYRESTTLELARSAGSFPELAEIRIIDPFGNSLYSSGAALAEQGGGSFAERGDLRSQLLAAGSSLHFSEVNAGAGNERSLMSVLLAVRDGAGELQGGVLAQIDLQALSRGFETVPVGDNGVVAIRRIDTGRLILRLPAKPELINQLDPNNPLHKLVESGGRQGVLRYQGSIDGVERVYAFQRVAEHPIYVAAGLATADYLIDWRRTLVVACVSALLLFLSLSLVLIRLLRAENEEISTSKRLVESEARYRMLAENSHDVIWTLDIPTRRYTYVSPSVTGLSGYLPEEIVGQTMECTLVPESAARAAGDVDQRLRRIAAGDQAASVVVSELDQICKNGEIISTEVVSSYLLNTEGVAHTILGITRNVSERKAAETALLEKNRQLRARIEEIGRLQVALQELAVRDSLTGLYNRRYLDETLDREVSRARREGNPLALVMLDIDYFKRVNDTYGHQVGDEVLKMLAATLMADIRAEDVACRYGGEEFLILLPSMPLENAVQRAEAWRRAVEVLRVTLGDFQITFTISLGVAAYPEHGKTPDDLTRCVDQALYHAKNHGRNQVSVYSA